jgi:hypothetical protein
MNDGGRCANPGDEATGRNVTRRGLQMPNEFSLPPHRGPQQNENRYRSTVPRRHCLRTQDGACSKQFRNCQNNGADGNESVSVP